MLAQTGRQTDRQDDSCIPPYTLFAGYTKIDNEVLKRLISDNFTE